MVRKQEEVPMIEVDDLQELEQVQEDCPDVTTTEGESTDEEEETQLSGAELRAMNWQEKWDFQKKRVVNRKRAK